MLFQEDAFETNYGLKKKKEKKKTTNILLIISCINKKIHETQRSENDDEMCLVLQIM